MKKLPINTQNKDVVVSWIYTWARQQEMSIHEQRIILRILEFCQDELKGLKIKDNLCKLEHNKYDVTIEMPASLAILQEFRSGHYNGNVRGVVKTILQVRGRQAMVDVLLHIKS